MKSPDLTCDVCNNEPAKGVASVPGVPVSVAYGEKCLAANAHPYGIVVANTALIGGYEHAAGWWRDMVDCTLSHLAIPRDKFNADVGEAMREVDTAP